jgi:hypothetical protein
VANRFFLRCTLTALIVSSSVGHAAHGGGASETQIDTEAYAVLQKVATQLGMVRGMQRTWRSINRIYFIAEHERPGEAFSQAVIELNYVQRAVRVIEQDQSQPKISVQRERRSWQESSPGVRVELVREAVHFSNWLYLTPHGVIRAALEAESTQPGSVTFEDQQYGSLVFESPNGRAEIVLGVSGLPSSVNLAQVRVSAYFEDYRDWELLDVMFPVTLRLQHADRSELYRVTEFRTNPYVVFPESTLP